MLTSNTARANGTRDEGDSVLTWRAVIVCAMTELGGKEILLGTLYKHLREHPKTDGRAHWKARVRATLEGAPELFVPIRPGLWSLATLYSEADLTKYRQAHRERWPLLGSRPRKESAE